MIIDKDNFKKSLALVEEAVMQARDFAFFNNFEDSEFSIKRANVLMNRLFRLHICQEDKDILSYD